MKRECVWCGKEFEIYTKKQQRKVYCSDKCRMAKSYQQQKEKGIKKVYVPKQRKMPMVNLTIDSINAEYEGMSYGAYKSKDEKNLIKRIWPDKECCMNCKYSERNGFTYLCRCKCSSQFRKTKDKADMCEKFIHKESVQCWY